MCGGVLANRGGPDVIARVVNRVGVASGTAERSHLLQGAARVEEASFKAIVGARSRVTDNLPRIIDAGRRILDVSPDKTPRSVMV